MEGQEYENFVKATVFYDENTDINNGEGKGENVVASCASISPCYNRNFQFIEGDMLDFILNCLIVILLPFRYLSHYRTTRLTAIEQICPALMAVLLAATACGASIAKTPASNSAIFFPRQKPVAGERDVPAGEISGRLVLVGACLRLNAPGNTSYTVVWPPHFTLRTTEDAVQILDDSNQVVGQVGDEIYLDGGETKSVEGIGAIDKKLQQELSFKCQGPYWLVGYVVKPLKGVGKSQ